MRPLFAAALVMALAATPALAAPSASTTLALQIVEKVCPAIQKDDYDGVVAASESLGLIDMLGVFVRQGPEADVLVLSSPVHGPDMAACQISVDYKPATSPDLVPAAEAWARAKGLKAKGPAVSLKDGKGQPYTQATWSGPAGRLLIRVYPAGANKRVNVTLEWHAAR